MMNTARLAFRQKKKTKSVKSVIFLHDNPSPQVASAMRQKLDIFDRKIKNKLLDFSNVTRMKLVQSKQKIRMELQRMEEFDIVDQTDLAV